MVAEDVFHISDYGHSARADLPCHFRYLAARLFADIQCRPDFHPNRFQKRRFVIGQGHSPPANRRKLRLFLVSGRYSLRYLQHGAPGALSADRFPQHIFVYDGEIPISFPAFHVRYVLIVRRFHGSGCRDSTPG